MPYGPGPLILQTQSDLTLPDDNYDFTDYAATNLGDVDSILSSWDSFFLDAGVLLDEPADPWPGIDLNAAQDTLGVYSDTEGLLGVSGMLSALGDADLLLSVAIGFAPPEAWVDPTTAFVPPGAAPTLSIPVIPPGAIDFSVTGTVSTTSAPATGAGGGAAPTVALTNTTAYGNPNFTVGDSFIVQITGAAGAEVATDGTLNGSPLPYSVVGNIAADGTFSLTGTMDPSVVGVWTENWYVGGQLIQSFDFVVLNA